MRMLIVEDDPELNRLLAKRLKGEGHSVDACLRGDDALTFLSGAEYDAVVLDIMLPGLSGLDVLRRLRARHGRTPVLLLTARDTVQDRVAGLDAGADDYLVKPFSFDELLARLRALLRRNYQTVSNVHAVADLALDSDRKTVSRGGNAIALSAKEFAILEVLALNKGAVLSREQINNHVWNYDYEGGSNIVDVYIRYLRKKIDDGFPVKLIHTVRGMGYVLREGA
jgi:DNA-binding response OmpR family regulator